MTQIEQHEQFIAALFAEVTSVKLILHALMKGVLPADQAEAWKEIEAMVTHIETLAKHGAMDFPNPEASEAIKRAAVSKAVDFVRILGPKMNRN